MGFKMMKTISPLLLFFLGVPFLGIEAQPQRRVDLYNPSVLENIQKLTPENAKQLHDPEIVQRLTPKNAEKLYDPEMVQRSTPKNAEKLYDPEMVQRLTPKTQRSCMTLRWFRG